MILNINDIKNITFGALEINDDGGVFTFNRMTEEQKDFYVGEHENHRARCDNSASVFFDFYTDSQSLSFNYKMYNSPCLAPAYACIDVWEGDSMIFHVGELTDKGLSGRADINLSCGVKRVRVYLPNMYNIELSNVELTDGALIKRAEKSRVALLLGDSITQGYYSEFPSLSYANIICRELELDAINQGIGGIVFRPDSLGTKPICDPEFITVALGINEWVGCDIDKENCRNYFEKLISLYPNAKIYYISPIYADAKIRQFGIDGFWKMINDYENVAESIGITVINGVDLMHKCPEFFTDGLHPNSIGFIQYGTSLIKRLDILQK